jgi:hypothetical protein
VRRSLLISVVLAAALPMGARADGTVVRAFRCDDTGAVTMAMENEYIAGSNYGGCWFHTGHHTYDLDALHAVGEIEGWLRSVEIQFSPPIEIGSSGEIRVFVEASTDGRVWATVGTVPYGRTSTRQDIPFAIDGGGVVARYLRIRQPRSVAQGLSGYLDVSSFDAELTPAEPPPVGIPREGTFQLSCETDIMEGFHALHPCWFGGINRYDSPSVFHTYPLNEAVAVTAISGTANYLPWRTDDYTGSGGSRRDLKGHLFASADGEHWTKLVTFDAQYGLEAPVAWTGSIDAVYLRFVAEYHKGVHSDPALKHVRGMLVHSALTVTVA